MQGSREKITFLSIVFDFFACTVLVVKARQLDTALPHHRLLPRGIQVSEDRVRDELRVEPQDLESVRIQFSHHCVLRSQEAETVVEDQDLF